MTPEHNINEQAARDFYGPAVYTAPRVVDVGEHKLEAWQLRAPGDGRADAPAPPAARRPDTRTPTTRDRHPFGRKPLRAAKATGGRVDLGTVTHRGRKPFNNPDRYVAPSPDDWRYSNNWH